MLGRSAPEAGKVDERVYDLAKQINQDEIEWTTEYFDWGGHTKDLPLGAKVVRADNSGKQVPPCLFGLWPAIFWNLDVGICACADFDAKLVVGNLHEDSLETILNSSRRSKMVAGFMKGKMPAYCTKCTFYKPAKTVGLQNEIVKRYS